MEPTPDQLAAVAAMRAAFRHAPDILYIPVTRKALEASIRISGPVTVNLRYQVEGCIVDLELTAAA